ncbi:MAG: hypothetical protein IJW23_13085 [Lentisphaeria bacterium]|nr:hypothetical protein [Lentisphaeria bacterium]
MDWHKITPELVFGRGWAQTEPEFGRLPAHAEKMLPEKVWKMRRNSSGMFVEFITDSKNVTLRWEVEDDVRGEPNFNICAESGIDLYVFVGKKWRFALALTASGKVNEIPALVQLTKKKRNVRLYLPFRNCLRNIEVGTDPGASFAWNLPGDIQPVVYYGSSIIHGSYGSRAGNGITQILGRAFNRPVINLGFSGSAKLEEGMAELLTELKPCCYLIDPLPNADASLLEERLEIFLRKLYSARKDIPVILLTDADRRNAWLYRKNLQAHKKKRETAARIVKQLQQEFPLLFLIDMKNAMGNDFEGTIDGIHPDELGVWRFSAFLIRELRKNSRIRSYLLN